MMDCKKALAEANCDIDAAVDVLRTRGLAALAKKAGRATNEGMVNAFVSADAQVSAIVEINCETDFVGKNADFQTFVGAVAAHVATAKPTAVATLMAQTFTGRDITTEQVFGEIVSKLGENMNITRFTRREVAGTGALGSYIHMGGKIGVVVEVALKNAASATNPAVTTLIKDLAMQVAAAAPISTNRDEVPADVVEHELSIYRAQAAESGKPEPIQQKMAEGRIQKFFKEVCLTEQVFVKNPDISVSQLVASVSKEVGDEISVVGFDRYALGETGEPGPAGC
jgi:elongation factor Ts